jgi:hypothetical protein
MEEGMDLGKEFRSKKKEHESAIDDHNRCYLCGSRLKFRHDIDYLLMVVREDSDCPSCRIQLRSKEHTLQ